MKRKYLDQGSNYSQQQYRSEADRKQITRVYINHHEISRYGKMSIFSNIFSHPEWVRYSNQYQFIDNGTFEKEPVCVRVSNMKFSIRIPVIGGFNIDKLYHTTTNVIGGFIPSAGTILRVFDRGGKSTQYWFGAGASMFKFIVFKKRRGMNKQFVFNIADKDTKSDGSRPTSIFGVDPDCLYCQAPENIVYETELSFPTQYTSYKEFTIPKSVVLNPGEYLVYQYFVLLKYEYWDYIQKKNIEVINEHKYDIEVL